MRMIWMSVIFLFGSLAAWGQNKHTEHTLKLEPGVKGNQIVLDSLHHLTGYWKGEALGGLVEELWLPASGGQMTGLFRLVVADTLIFTEHMQLGTWDGVTQMRIKHVSPDGATWEPKEETTRFSFIRLENNTCYFSGLTIDFGTKDHLIFYLAMKKKDGSSYEESFRFRRVTL